MATGKPPSPISSISPPTSINPTPAPRSPSVRATNKCSTPLPPPTASPSSPNPRPSRCFSWASLAQPAAAGLDYRELGEGSHHTKCNRRVRRGAQRLKCLFSAGAMPTRTRVGMSSGPRYLDRLAGMRPGTGGQARPVERQPFHPLCSPFPPFPPRN